ncbi:E3 ubiquitin-protein ligase znrf1-like [Xyrauchen texanus]|uniref:E3 ubiquitin-protein ligase znrf1-like n=1 Tax=Xyrauchen texanus TaxID=154827 RepID=UPI0022424863|nr:E3 ubiquitin-protein ligase znrf1-like [Xyrauchen texanus]
MGTRSSRLHEEAVPTPFDKDDIKRESCRRIRSTRPTSLMVEFSGSFDHDSEAKEEGSDSDTGQQASSDVSPADRHMSPSLSSQASPTGENGGDEKREEDGSPGGPVNEEEMGRVPQRTFSERLPAGRHSSGSGVTARSARVRGTQSRPVSEAWIGLYRVNNRHGAIRCPFCTKPFPGGRIEDHLLSCLTSPPLPYNTDVLAKDSGECSICLEDLLQGETIARLACLCVYHKSCIDTWSKVKPCCPEHPFD